MQPSTHRTAPGASGAGLPAGLLAVVVAGSAGLFATFWDDAWHTDLGRDQATIPPHLWLPVDASSANRLVQHRQLYLPAGRTQGARLPGSEVAAGIVLYAPGALLLALIIRQVRGPARTQPVLHAARTHAAATHGGGVGPRRAPGRLGP
jgi:hypothetical protein